MNTRSTPLKSDPEIRPAAIVISPQEGLAIATSVIGTAHDILVTMRHGDEVALAAVNENLDIACKVFRKWPGLFQLIYTDNDKFIDIGDVGSFIRDAITMRISK